MHWWSKSGDRCVGEERLGRRGRALGRRGYGWFMDGPEKT